MPVSTAAVLVICCLAAWYDVAQRRVPNWLSAGFAALALGSHAFTGGLDALLASAGGLILALALLFPLFALRGLGAGDVKFVAALGAAVTLPEVPRLLLGTVIAASVIALADVARRRLLLRTVGGLVRVYRGLPDIDSPDALLVPFTLASAAAAWWVLLVPRG